MTWGRAASLALKGFTRRAGRQALTVLAVALAAALLTALLAIVSIARTQLLSQLSRGAPLATIKVTGIARDYAQVTGNLPKGPSGGLDRSAILRLARLPGVVSAVPVTDTEVLVLPLEQLPDTGIGNTSSGSSSPDPFSAGRPFVGTLAGANLAMLPDLPLTVVAGRLPAPGSLTEVAVTPAYLTRLGLDPNNPRSVVGTQLQLGVPGLFPALRVEPVRPQWIRVGVVGVVVEAAAPAQVFGSEQLVQEAQGWLLARPGTARWLHLSTAPYAGLIVVARDLAEVRPLADRIRALGYVAAAPENLIASVLRYLHVVELVLGGVAVIAMVIAALGIANAMLAAVRERRREIGVLRAIGAGRGDVRRIFLLEAGLVGVLGGAAGAGAGWAGAQVMRSVINHYLAHQGLSPIGSGFGPSVVAIGLLVSVVLSLAAGAVPAGRAGRLSPVEAIRDGT